MWAFPTTPELTDVTSKLASVLTGACAKYLLGAELRNGLRIGGTDSLDASVWRVDNILLVSIVNSAYQDTKDSPTIYLPPGMTATSITNVAWGDGKWKLAQVGDSSRIQRTRLQGLGTDILLLSLKAGQDTAAAGDEQDVIAVS